MAEEGTGRKVMVAIDESESSLYALEWVLHNLHSCCSSSSPLIVFTVQPISSTTFLPAILGPVPGELIQSIQEQQKKFSLALLEKAREICGTEGVMVETITEVGDPKESICAVAEKLNIDLLVLGTHGRGVVKRTFLGSVSNYCVHHAKCPVLVVKKKA